MKVWNLTFLVIIVIAPGLSVAEQGMKAPIIDTLSPIEAVQRVFWSLESAWQRGDLNPIDSLIDKDTRTVFSVLPHGPSGMYNSDHVLALLEANFNRCAKRMLRFTKFRNLGVPGANPYGVARLRCFEDTNRSNSFEEVVFVSLRYKGRRPVIESIKTQSLSSTQSLLVPHQ